MKKLNPKIHMKCAFCDWFTLRVYANKKGQKKSGWSKLIDHVAFAHPAEYDRIVVQPSMEDADIREMEQQ